MRDLSTRERWGKRGAITSKRRRRYWASQGRTKPYSPGEKEKRRPRERGKGGKPPRVFLVEARGPKKRRAQIRILKEASPTRAVKEKKTFSWQKEREEDKASLTVKRENMMAGPERGGR